MRRSSVVLPQPDGPSSVKSSPSPISSSTPLTAASAPKRFVSPRTPILIKKSVLFLQLVPVRFYVLAELVVHLLVARLRLVVVVQVGDFLVEVGAHPAGELDRL